MNSKNHKATNPRGKFTTYPEVGTGSGGSRPVTVKAATVRDLLLYSDNLEIFQEWS